ncbi:MAG TPA: glycoside hydrolase family 76 protein [Solirubrobacteraceae bacterium]|nr:glycoside hydrolase family 76 protein [Solirubrobacteraceae bacterium]
MACIALALALCTPALAARPSHAHPKPKGPVLDLYAKRALTAYTAMQQNFYVSSAGLYRGEPEYSFLWPFSQALAASVSVAHLSGEQPKLESGLRALGASLQEYASSAASTAEASGASTATTLRSYEDVTVPPVGPGGASYYDDNEWVGIELARMYELDHDATALTGAEQIMQFVMAGWQTTNAEGQLLPCPGGVPFSNAKSNTQRNTITDGPAAELGVQLYRITHEARYLQFAQTAYGWVRECLLEPSGLYADHIELNGTVDHSLWSYTQGVMIGAGALLYQVTHQGAYLSEARQTAQAAHAYFTYGRLASENPFFAAVYFRNQIYLDSITHEPPGTYPAREYAFWAWERHRLDDDLFAYGSPPTAELLGQAALTQIYALLAIPPRTYF